jgi:hypothetical protein
MANYSINKNDGQKYNSVNSSEKQKSTNVASALTWSVRRAISKEKYLSCDHRYNTYSCDHRYNTYRAQLDKFIKKRGIAHNAKIELLAWGQNRRIQQKGQLFHLTMHLNVMRDGDNDLIFPFSLWPLRSNKSFYNASDEKLAEKFTQSLKKELKALNLNSKPEYYYIITGEPNPKDKGNLRHIHGCLRLPSSLYDELHCTAVKEVYDALKRACGLSKTRKDRISKGDKRGGEYKFAVTSLDSKRPDKNKPYGYMVDLGDPLKPDWSQERWSEYIVSKRNQPNNIHRSDNLITATVLINDQLHAELEKLKLCGDLADNTSRFERTTIAWEAVISDYIKPTESEGCIDKVASHSRSEEISPSCEKDEVSEDKSKRKSNSTLKDLIARERTKTEQEASLEAHNDCRTHRPESHPESHTVTFRKEQNEAKMKLLREKVDRIFNPTKATL